MDSWAGIGSFMLYKRPSSPALKRAAIIYGWGGIGKTVLASSISHEDESSLRGILRA